MTRVAWEATDSHSLASGTDLPIAPTEMELFYKTDEHKWYQYNGSDWISLVA